MVRYVRITGKAVNGRTRFEPAKPQREVKGRTAVERPKRVDILQLDHFLSQPLALRFLFCEFWYTDVERRLYLEPDDFRALLHDCCPALRARRLRRAEWAALRRRMGKPRRLSAGFLRDEVASLREKRALVDQLYAGRLTHAHGLGLPGCLPKPPVIGARVMFKVDAGRLDIYQGVISRFTKSGVLVRLNKHNRQTTTYLCNAKYCELVQVDTPDLVLTNELIFKNFTYIRRAPTPAIQVVGRPGPMFISRTTPKSNGWMSYLNDYNQEKVGRFPLRLLVVLVKFDKVLGRKSELVRQLRLLNDHAMRMEMLGAHRYPPSYMDAYRNVLSELATLDRLIHNYEAAVRDYRDLPGLNNNSLKPSDRPEQLRLGAEQSAKRTLDKVVVSLREVPRRQHARARPDDLMARFPATVTAFIREAVVFLYQMRRLRHAHGAVSATDVALIQTAVRRLRAQLPDEHHKLFDDSVGVHLKEMLLQLVHPRRKPP